jgi:hypothetical protein
MTTVVWEPLLATRDTTLMTPITIPFPSAPQRPQ